MVDSQVGRPRRILSLDGGGIRGLSTILILKRLMRLYNEGSAVATEQHPWQIFDMICGTSTGGIIAIMLGRLHMSLDECEDAYLRLSEKIFSPRRSRNDPLRGIDYLKAKGKFDHKALEDAVRSELNRLAEPQTAQSSSPSRLNHELQLQKTEKPKSRFRRLWKNNGENIGSKQQELENDEGNSLLWEENGECKVFVCTVRQKSTQATALRSYNSEDNMDSIYKICKVWEAVRATAAAPGFFDPISIGKFEETFIDGGLRENNPISRAQVEASRLWPEQKLIFTSIGTGIARIRSFEGGLVTLANRLANIATDCDHSWESFCNTNKAMRDEGRLFRFTAGGLEDVLLGEVAQKNLIADRTNSYLEKGSTKEEVQKCAKALLCLEAPVKAVSKLPVAGMGLSNIPFEKNSNFIGRKSIIEKVEKQLLSAEDCQRVTLWGLGGTGKTQIALECAFRRMKRSPGCSVFWIPAISSETFEKAYLDIGKLFKIPGITEQNADMMTLVKNKLNHQSSGEWLLVIDNADDSEVLFKKRSLNGTEPTRLIDLLPSSSRGSILFTTRTRNVAFEQVQAHDKRIKITELSNVEAEDLLAKILGQKALLREPEATDKLLSLLAYLPLAIVQAAKFISHADIHLTDYILAFERSESNTIRMLSEDFEDRHRYPNEMVKNPIATTWYISFQRIQKEDPLAEVYLKYMACLLRENIPQALLPKAVSDIDFEKATGTLTAYAFITKQGNVQMFDMHRLVHLATRNWLKDQNQMASQTRITLSRVNEILPFGGHEGRSIWTEYLPHAIHVAASSEGLVEPEIRVLLLDKIRQCQYNLGQYEAALRTCRQALGLKINLLGEENPSTLYCRDGFATALNGTGRYVEAETMFHDNLVLSEKILGKEHPLTIMTMRNLGHSIRDQGGYAKAETMIRQSLVLGEKVFGIENPYTLYIRKSLGLVLNDRGMYAEAEAIYLEVLAIREKVLGKEHPETLSLNSNLASTLNHQGKYTEAEAICLEVLAIRERVLGKEHPDTLTTKTTLASTLNHQGKYAEAEALYLEVLAIREKVLGKEHPDTLSLKNNFTGTLDYQGRYAEAEVICLEVLAAREKVLGKEHPDTLTTRNSLASTLNLQGKCVEAEAIYLDVLAIREKVSGKDHPETLSLKNNLALTLNDQGRYAEAEALYLEVLATKNKVSREDHPDTLTIKNNLGLVLHHQQKFIEAEAIYRRTVALQEKVLGKEHPETSNTKYNLGTVLCAQGRYSEAMKVLRGTLAQKEKVLGKDHPETLKTKTWFEYTVEMAESSSG